MSLPLAGHADTMLAELAAATGTAMPDGATLLGERAMLAGSRIPGLVSAGGGCRLLPARGDWIALNLARADDRDLLPALFEDGGLEPWNDGAVAAAMARADAAQLVARGREMGLAIAGAHEPSPPAVLGEVEARAPGDDLREMSFDYARDERRRRRAPRVLDLSALWAGPLAGHLLQLAGAEVIKVESPRRPDAMRVGQPAFSALLNGGKRSVLLEPGDARLLELIAGADIVIEAARPRALLQAGIDADALVRRHPGLVWLTITAHGMTGGAAGWVGFGDDVGVAAGLAAAMLRRTGRPGFVGDAIADPVTGIRAALTGWQAWSAMRGGRYPITMRDLPVPEAAELDAWAAAEGHPFPAVARRPALPVRPLGADPPCWPC